uniref:Uncharacterized protein n=1 Tax=Anopheles stephensi TaxID=30069 RepID=A0A182YN75_ANOST
MFWPCCSVRQPSRTPWCLPTRPRVRDVRALERATVATGTSAGRESHATDRRPSIAVRTASEGWAAVRPRSLRSASCERVEPSNHTGSRRWRPCAVCRSRMAGLILTLSFYYLNMRNKSIFM